MGIILASQSPRRKELLELAGIEHRVIVSQVDEILDEDLDVAGQVQDLAIQKLVQLLSYFLKRQLSVLIRLLYLVERF